MVLLLLDKLQVIVVIHLPSMILLGAQGAARKEKKKKKISKKEMLEKETLNNSTELFHQTSPALETRQEPTSARHL